MIIDFFTREILDEADIKLNSNSGNLETIDPILLVQGFVSQFRSRGYKDDHIIKLMYFTLEIVLKKHNAE